jgi:hypothetical protein
MKNIVIHAKKEPIRKGRFMGTRYVLSMNDAADLEQVAPWGRSSDGSASQMSAGDTKSWVKELAKRVQLRTGREVEIIWE